MPKDGDKKTGGLERAGNVGDSTAARAAIAAVAGGAAAYAISRAFSDRGSSEDDRSRTDEDDDGQMEASREQSGARGLLAKKDDLAETLVSKAADAKQAVTQLRPGRKSDTASSVLGSAWDAASEYLLPLAGQAAASLGERAAENAPEAVRDELIPRFIEGFQKAS
jgi:hypothetical protein